jgi:phytoene synthase
MADAAARTRALFARGRRVGDAVPGRLGYELRLTWLGGMRILDRLEAAAFDTVRARPTLGAGDVPALAWGAATWRATRPDAAR